MGVEAAGSLRHPQRLAQDQHRAADERVLSGQRAEHWPPSPKASESRLSVDTGAVVKQVGYA